MHGCGSQHGKQLADLRCVSDETATFHVCVGLFDQPFRCAPGAIGPQARNPLDPARRSNVLNPERNEIPAWPKFDMKKSSAALDARFGAAASLPAACLS
jgi:hypothetical protein